MNPGLSSRPLPRVTRASTLPAVPLPNPSPELFQLVRDTSTYNNRLPTPSAQHYANPPSPYVAPVSRNETPAETVIDVQSGLPADLVDPPLTSVPGVPNTSVPIDEQAGLPADLVDPPPVTSVSDAPNANTTTIQGSHTPWNQHSVYSNTQSQESDYANTPRGGVTQTAPSVPPGGDEDNTLAPPSGFGDNDLEEDDVDGVFYDGSDEGATDPSYVNALRPNYV